MFFFIEKRRRRREGLNFGDWGMVERGESTHGPHSVRYDVSVIRPIENERGVD